MKKSGSLLIPEEWKKVARKDWDRVIRNLRDEDIEAAGFFLQQSLEKYLKAFLLSHGWKLRKIHALHDLLNDAVNYNPALEEFRKLCEKVTGYYLVDRYPLFTSLDLTYEDIEKDLEYARKFINTMFSDEKLSGKK